jgi:GNAT superfamily N-acetyltransferase
MEVTIRLYQPADFESIVILWRISREKSLPDFQRQKGHFFYEDMDYFRDHVLVDNTVWVAVDSTHRPVAFMAIKGDFIDHLYVHPYSWRKGIGEQLLAHARTLSPRHLWLYTLQSNINARAFYEKHGFKAVKFGLSPAPENEPDIKYEWSREG